MKKVILLLIILSSLSNFSCTDRDDQLAEVNIRIKNASSYVFDEVQVGDAETLLKNIAPNEFSEYLEFETAYRYAFIEIKSGDETFTLPVIDFVGETPLTFGFYTYILHVDDEGNVSLDLVSDL